MDNSIEGYQGIGCTTHVEINIASFRNRNQQIVFFGESEINRSDVRGNKGWSST
jgi:thymidylate kinase